MKKLALAALAARAAFSIRAADRFVFSSDGATVGSSPRELPTQGVSLASGQVVVGLHALGDERRAECGWYRVLPGEKPVAESNEVWRVSGYTFSTNGTATAQYSCTWRKVQPKTYSKLAVITALKSLPGLNGDANAWTSVKRAIEEADLADEWNACTYLAEDNALFAALKARAAAMTGLSEDEIEEVLSKCLY